MFLFIISIIIIGLGFLQFDIMLLWLVPVRMVLQMLFPLPASTHHRGDTRNGNDDGNGDVVVIKLIFYQNKVWVT